MRGPNITTFNITALRIVTFKVAKFLVAITFVAAPIIFAFYSSFYSSLAWAYDPYGSESMLADKKPQQLEEVGVRERLGEFIDLGLTFRSDSGEMVSLGEVFDGSAPILMTMVYYNCPSLCNYHLNGLNDVFKKMTWDAGRDFKLVVVSMDHREDSNMASIKKSNYIREFWPFWSRGGGGIF